MYHLSHFIIFTLIFTGTVLHIIEIHKRLNQQIST